jgi:hypothetical protein
MSEVLTMECSLERFTDITRNLLTLKNGSLTQFVKFRGYPYPKLVVYFSDEHTLCKKCASKRKSGITHFRLYPAHVTFACSDCGKTRDYVALSKKWKRKLITPCP